MQYSPKLKMVMEKIKAILDEADVGAQVTLHVPGFMEFLSKIDPSWSVASYQQVGPELGVRFRLQLADFKGDVAARDKAGNDTINMLQTMQDGSALLFGQIGPLLEVLGKKLDIEYTRDSITGHDQQNN